MAGGPTYGLIVVISQILRFRTYVANRHKSHCQQNRAHVRLSRIG